MLPQKSKMPIGLPKKQVPIVDVKDELERRNKAAKSTLNCYHPTETREEAVQLLKSHYKSKRVEGCFLVRPSMTVPTGFSLSVVQNGEVVHYRVDHVRDTYFILKEVMVNGLDRLIREFQMNTKSLCFTLSESFIEGEPLPIHARVCGVSNMLHETAANVDEILKLKMILKSQLCPDVNERNENGRTALDIACEYDNVDAVKEIIKKNPIMNLKALDDYTALHRAAENNSINVIDYLLTNELIDPTERSSEDNFVPLHVAARWNNFMCVKMLLKHNVPDKPRTPDNKTPLDIALIYGCTESADVLMSYEPKKAKTKVSEWMHEDNIRRDVAQKILLNAFKEQGDGVFLVRSKSSNSFVLSVMTSAEFYNFEICVKGQEKLFFIDDGPYFRTLEHLIEYYMRYMDGMSTLLLHPVSSKSIYCENLRNIETKFNNTETVRNKIRRKVLLKDVSKEKEKKKSALDAINAGDIQFGEILGQGEFGTVYKAVLTSSRQVAVKVLKDFKASEEFEREAQLMKQLGNHPCILRIFCTIKEKDTFMMVQELMVCSLLDKLYESPRLITDDNLKKWAIEIVSGMNHMESKKIVHRDLAARNVLLGSNLQAKISDFGLSRAFEGDEYTQTSECKIPIKWYAPESIERCRFTSKSDVWSFGVILWEMWTYGDIPYGNMNGTEVFIFLKLGSRLNRPEGCSSGTFEIMKKCWIWDDEKRWSFEQLMKEFIELSQDNSDYANVNTIYIN